MLTKVIMTIVMQYITSMISSSLSYSTVLSGPGSCSANPTPLSVFYYHTNHLGSTAFVTDGNASVTQGFLYAPFGEITTEYNVNFGNNVIPKYSFNAKELDEETGMYYYEARYYNPPVFTSRDPMFEKYFWMSPYAYCANNPVKFVDPTGMDFDPVIDEENKTITIRAKYYTSKENIEDLQKGIDAWNNQSGKYQYVVGKGKNKEKYSIRFDLEIVACETNEDASHQYELDKSGMANYYDGRTYIGNNGDAQGITADGRSIRLNADANQISNVTRTMSHEIGHTLGISHWTQGLMKTGGTESWMSKDYVWQILSTSGFNPRFPNISWDGNMIDLSNDKNHINIWKSHVFTPKPITLQNGIVKSIWP